MLHHHPPPNIGNIKVACMDGSLTDDVLWKILNYSLDDEPLKHSPVSVKFGVSLWRRRGKALAPSKRGQGEASVHSIKRLCKNVAMNDQIQSDGRVSG